MTPFALLISDAAKLQAMQVPKGHIDLQVEPHYMVCTPAQLTGFSLDSEPYQAEPNYASGRWSNAFYEKNMTDFICECIPMMIFMPKPQCNLRCGSVVFVVLFHMLRLCFFGWMDCMILYKCLR